MIFGELQSENKEAESAFLTIYVSKNYTCPDSCNNVFRLAPVVLYLVR
jgi:hypothetical protein